MSSSPYAQAARLLGTIWESKKSLKALAYDKKGNLIIQKSTYAQVCHVLEHKHHLDAVLKEVSIQCHNQGLLYILLYELLLGPNKKIRGGGALRRQLYEQNDLLQAAMAKQLVGIGSDGNDTAMAIVFPRYVRVNTLQTTVQHVVEWIKKNCPTTAQIYLDPTVPNLLVLPPKTILQELVALGQVVLQDKSSCFSALCLAHVNGDCIDACAAPGNKTSHLCMLLNTTTTRKKQHMVIAMDRNKQRLEMMVQRITPLLPNNTKQPMMEAKLIDFLTTNPKDYPTVKGILLDPSCSGSGMYTRHHQTQDDQRIQTLSNFQVTALKHAMSFPNVTNLVYSTCSIHEQENEHVVRQALEQYRDDWNLVAPLTLQKWERRGHPVDGLTPEQVACLIRADLDDDTNGFFVAYFERSGTKPNPTPIEPASMVTAMGGLEFYSGQFARIETDMTKAIPKVQPPVSTWENDPVISKRRKTTTIVLKEEPEAKIAPKKSGNDKVVMVKKAAKKQAWKQRQMGQKKTRLLQKAANTKAPQA